MRNHSIITRTCAILVLSLMFGCATIPPRIASFRANPSSITAGDSAVLTWSVENLSEKSRIRINGNDVDTRLQQYVVSPASTTVYQLTVTEAEKDLTTETASLTVLPKQQPKIEIVNIPAAERVNTTESAFAKGIINFENVKSFPDDALQVIGMRKGKSRNQIELLCTVRDRNGNLVANLAKPFNHQNAGFFEGALLISGQGEQKLKITDIREVRVNTAPPHSTLLVLDNSGSMSRHFSALEESLGSFLRQFRSGLDDFSVYQFDHRESLTLNHARAVSDITNILNFNEFGGGTAFYSSCVNAMNAASVGSAEKEKIAILFTDGHDNNSLFTDANDVVAATIRNGYRAFVVGFEQAAGCINRQVLSKMAQMTGGKAYFSTDGNNLDEIFAEIYEEINSYYIITVEHNTDTFVAPQPLTFAIVTKKDGRELRGTGSFYISPEKIEEEGKQLTMVTFKPNSNTPEDVFSDVVTKLAEHLRQNPGKKILITGHSDSRGAETKNKVLSRRRAAALRDLLVKAGVSPKQIAKVEGKGFSEPLHPDDACCEWMQAENRRANVVIL